MSCKLAEAGRIAVIVPTLQEAGTIAGALASLADQGVDEIVVADGGSVDGTADMARSAGATVVVGPRGRGRQQNEGAAATKAPLLVFLHADCRLEAGALAGLRRFAVRNPRVPAGCFRMRVEAGGLGYRAIDAAAHLRAGVLGVPYGDQALFVRREAFEQVGGFPEVRLMEDVLIALRLRRLGRIALLPWRVTVSPRRWQRVGLARQSVRNWALTAAAAVGVHPDRLSRFYPVVR